MRPTRSPRRVTVAALPQSPEYPIATKVSDAPRRARHLSISYSASTRTGRISIMNTPKSNEERLNRIINGWTNHANDKTFAGMTLAQFKTLVEPSFSSRRKLIDLDLQRAQTVNERDDADAVSMEKADKVVAAVIGDLDFGDDSSLYESFGYTRKSER